MRSLPPTPSQVWQLSPTRAWLLDRPRLLGILNITPDSFSDGGTHQTLAHALAAAETMLTQGADGLDVGGESTRPGAPRIPDDEQARRVLPIIAALRHQLGDHFAITIDTTRSAVAAAALDVGADAINDVSAATDDPAMLALAARRGCGLILMHRAMLPERDVYSHQHAAEPAYGDAGVVGTVREYLAARIDGAVAAGISRAAIVIDPGLGFGKSVTQNQALIEATSDLAGLGCPVMSGLSRKSFVAKLAGLDIALLPRERDSASVELSLHHRLRGARIFRVHNISAHAAAFLRT